MSAAAFPFCHVLEWIRNWAWNSWLQPL